MTLDKDLFSDEQAITVTAASTNVRRFPNDGNIGGGQSVRLYAQAVEDFAGVGRAEKTTIVALAEDSSTGAADGDLNGDYITLCVRTNPYDAETKYAVWFNTGSSTAPTVAEHTNVECAVATGATNLVVGAALTASINTIPYVTATLATATVTIENDVLGAVTTATEGTAGWAAPTRVTEGVNASTVVIALQDSAAEAGTYRDQILTRALAESDPRLKKGGIPIEVTVPKEMREYHRLNYTVVGTCTAGKIVAGYIAAP